MFLINHRRYVNLSLVTTVSSLITALLSFRLESAKKTIEGLKSEKSAMLEMQDMLKRHNDTLKQQHDVSVTSQHVILSCCFFIVVLFLLLCRATQQLTEMEDERKHLSKQVKERDVKLTGTLTEDIHTTLVTR